MLEHAVLLAPQHELGDGGDIPGTLGRVQHELNNPVGVRIGKRLEQHRVDDRENRRVRADAEGQRRDGGGGERRTLAEHAQGVLEVVQETLHFDLPLLPVLRGRRAKRIEVCRDAFDGGRTE